MLKRLLPFALLCTAGTVYVGTLGAPTLAGAAVGTLVGIFSGIVSNDLAAVWDKVAKRLQGNEAILKNEDLTKAVGLAIAAIIAQTAKDETKVNLAYRSEIGSKFAQVLLSAINSLMIPCQTFSSSSSDSLKTRNSVKFSGLTENN